MADNQDIIIETAEKGSAPPEPTETAVPVNPVEEKESETTLAEELEETPSAKRSALTVALAFMGGLILGGLIAGGYFYALAGRVSSLPQTPELVSEPVPTAEPTVTGVAVDLSQYQVQVLNGSGVAGAAARARGVLQNLGFRQIDVGNAATAKVVGSKAELKASVPEAVFAQVKTALTDHQLVLGEGLPETENYDLIITLGLEN